MVVNLMLRIISSIVLLITVLGVLYLGGYAVYALIILTSMLEYREWENMTEQKLKLVQFIGAILIVALNTSFIFIYATDSTIFLWLLVCVVSNDVFAYFIGKTVGGYKLFAKISPNKTWSGFFGGILGAFIFGGAFIFATSLALHLVFLSICVAVLATIGDLLESAAKRYCNVKDSGSIIPGHGGILDRIDGFIFSAPFVTYVLM